MENDQIVQQPFVPEAPVEDASQRIQEPVSSLIPPASFEEVQAIAANDVATDPGTEFVENIQHLMDEMNSLRHDFDIKIKYDESKERQIDSLHRELQGYREGLHFKILRPLFIDLIAMHDDLSKLIEGMTNTMPNEVVDHALKNYTSFQITIEAILQRNGVEPFSVDGSSFISNRQRALQPIDTSEPELDKQIVRRVRKGFEYEGRVIRPEIVITYRFVSEK